MRRLILAASLFAIAGCGAEQTQSVQAPAPVDPAVMQARIEALPAPYNEATYDAGRRAFGQCRACHTINEGGGDRVGPNLHGVFGRQAGTLESFSKKYSPAVRDAGFVWDAAQLDHWLENPGTFLPGNRMGFAGSRNPEERRDLIAYLMVETQTE